MADTVSVVIADDHRLIRELLCQALSGKENIQVVGEAANGPEAVDVIGRLNPDIVLLDIMMPGMDGIKVISPLRERSPKTKPLMLTARMDEGTIFEAIRAGARGYISKDASIEDLFKAIEAVHQGELWVERKLISRFLDEEAMTNPVSGDRPRKDEEGLTRREREVLRYLATGSTNKEIAKALFISEKTVKSHVNSIFKKLKVSRRLEAILYAIDKGLT